jgi:hypothetical protein
MRISVDYTEKRKERQAGPEGKRLTIRQTTFYAIFLAILKYETIIEGGFPFSSAFDLLRWGINIVFINNTHV